MTNSKQYDLEERTLKFAEAVRDFVKELPRNFLNRDYIVQLIRASSSVGANYIEANEALSRKDFVHRIKICRKEAKESRYWLNLIEVQDKNLLLEQEALRQEATELTMIFSSIMRKSR
ncbi:four helix bundle protein [Candidatus Roizmanbacteria bacterium]|nr:four helix bundle protein [Candidatus Roizmanbacteria bacterium]